MATIPLWLREPEDSANVIVVPLKPNGGVKPSAEKQQRHSEGQCRRTASHYLILREKSKVRDTDLPTTEAGIGKYCGVTRE
jgi:hypothetical protein